MRIQGAVFGALLADGSVRTSLTHANEPASQRPCMGGIETNFVIRAGAADWLRWLRGPRWPSSSARSAVTEALTRLGSAARPEGGFVFLAVVPGETGAARRGAAWRCGAVHLRNDPALRFHFSSIASFSCRFFAASLPPPPPSSRTPLPVAPTVPSPCRPAAPPEGEPRALRRTPIPEWFRSTLKSLSIVQQLNPAAGPPSIFG